MSITANAQTTKNAKNLAEKLGYKATDKLLIIHADDVGMCHSVNVATIQAMEKGVVTCAAIMMPCPWMPEIARYCREHPDADFGLHLTMTSEWKDYRWRPVSPMTEVPGLIDNEGFMPHDVPEVVQKAKPAEVEKEIRAQIARAKQFGINPTHVDSHMGTLFAAPFFPVYTRVAKEMKIPPMVLRATPERIKKSAEFGLDFAKIEKELDAGKFPMLDILEEDVEGNTLKTRREFFYNLLRNLKPGVTEIIVHLAMNDDEVKHIMNGWQNRYNEFLIVTDPKTRQLIDSLGIKLIGYKDLKKIAFQ